MEHAGEAPVYPAGDLLTNEGTVTAAIGCGRAMALLLHERFSGELGRGGRVTADTLIRLLIMAMFSLFTRQLIVYGARLRGSGEVSMTLQLPVLWLPM